jgi:hypothetical protein
MLSMPNFAIPELAHVQTPLLLLAMLAVSLLLIFAGSSIAKIVAFVAVGLVGAAFVASLAAQFLSPASYLVGAILGFAIGGLLGVVMIILGIGLIAGYAGYLLALDFGLSPFVGLVAGIVAFVVGLWLSDRILALGTAVVGGFLLFNTLTYLGLGYSTSIVVAAATTLIGIGVQWGLRRRMAQPNAPRMGGQPNDHR